MAEDNVIIADGDYLIKLDGRAQVTNSESSTMMIIENSAGAVLIFGFADENGVFVPYPNGVFNDGKKINHGIGCRLMVRVSNITADSVTIRRFPG